MEVEKKEVNPLIQEVSGGTTLPTRTKTIKVDVRTWDSLKGLRRENETFNDVIKDLLNERTKSRGDDNVKAIKYQRKIAFFNFKVNNKDLGFEFEYNDVKGNKTDFVLDVRIKKVFFGRKCFSPSEFFGVDNSHRHYSYYFMVTHLGAVNLALQKEFRISTEKIIDFDNLVLWRQLYYDYNLSEESFKSDIVEPLRLSEEEIPSKEWQKRIKNSVIEKLTREEDKQ